MDRSDHADQSQLASFPVDQVLTEWPQIKGGAAGRKLWTLEAGWEGEGEVMISSFFPMESQVRQLFSECEKHSTQFRSSFQLLCLGSSDYLVTSFEVTEIHFSHHRGHRQTEQYWLLSNIFNISSGTYNFTIVSRQGYGGMCKEEISVLMEIYGLCKGPLYLICHSLSCKMWRLIIVGFVQAKDNRAR